MITKEYFSQAASPRNTEKPSPSMGDDYIQFLHKKVVGCTVNSNSPAENDILEQEV